MTFRCQTTWEWRGDRGLAPPGWPPGRYSRRLPAAAGARGAPSRRLSALTPRRSAHRPRPNRSSLCSQFKAALPSVGMPLDRPSRSVVYSERIKNLEMADDPSVVAGPARGGAAISGTCADSGAAGRAGSPARDHARLARRDLRRGRLGDSTRRDDGCGQQRHRTLFSRMLRSRMPLSPASVAATGSRRLRVPLPSATMRGKRGVLQPFIKLPNERFRPGKWICWIGPGWRRRRRVPRCSTP